MHIHETHHGHLANVQGEPAHVRAVNQLAQAFDQHAPFRLQGTCPLATNGLNVTEQSSFLEIDGGMQRGKGIGRISEAAGRRACKGIRLFGHSPYALSQQRDTGFQCSE